MTANQPKPYNPLELRTLAESMVRELLRQPVLPLGSLTPFEGTGVYAIYYSGDFEPYAPIAAKNQGDKWDWPIYVGKAARKGGRKGGFLSDIPPGKALYNRLVQHHAQSITEAQNLEIDDFFCRYLLTEEVFMPLCESLLIDRYTPIWNTVIEGFGIKVTGKNREQQISPWDILHPGRRGRGVKPNKKFRNVADVKKKLTEFIVGLGC
jgi:hypothetical protein